MFAVELTVQSRGRVSARLRVDAIYSLLAALYRNGSLTAGYSVIRDSGGVKVHGVAPARDAFRKSNWNRYVRRTMDRLREAGLERPRVRYLGVAQETGDPCRCARPSGYILFTTFIHTEPPVRCLRCGGFVPLYRIPRPASDEHDDLLTWKSNYQACDNLQIACSVGERFGERQMADLDSELSRSGLAIRDRIRAQTGRPAYYFLVQWPRKRRRAGSEESCPGCGRAWRLQKPFHGFYQFKCDRCLLLSWMPIVS